MFLALVDEPVAGYIRRRRLTEAARVLRAQADARVLDVALAAGFESHEAFTRAFRRESGHTPSGFRNHPQPNLSWMRLPCPPATLQLLPETMQPVPEILDVPAFSVVGLSARFIAAMSPDANNLAVIPPLWGRFMERRVELVGTGAVREVNVSFGVCRCLPPEQRTRDDELVYLAGAGVRGDVILPEGMERWEIPGGRYARFTHRGPVESFSETLNAIYGGWFPRSDYEPVMEIEYELYDERFKLGAEDSEVDYYVAVRQRA